VVLLLLFVDGVAGRLSHYLWVVVVDPSHAVRGWWWWALVMPFVGGGGVPPRFLCAMVCGCSSITAPPSTADTTHFLQMDDLDSIDLLVLESMCAADVDEYTYTAECAWLATQDSLHASVGWHERRRNIEELDLAAIMAVPLPSSSKCSDVSLESLPFLLDSACTTHISPEQSNFATLHPISDRTVTGVGGSSIHKGWIHTTKLGLGLKGHLTHPSHSRQIFDEEKAGVYTEILQGPYPIFSLRNFMQRKAVEAKKYPRCAFSRFLFTCVCLDHQLEKFVVSVSFIRKV